MYNKSPINHIRKSIPSLLLIRRNRVQPRLLKLKLCPQCRSLVRRRIRRPPLPLPDLGNLPLNSRRLALVSAAGFIELCDSKSVTKVLECLLVVPFLLLPIGLGVRATQADESLMVEG